MRGYLAIVLVGGLFLIPGMAQAQAQESSPAQKRIMIERGKRSPGNGSP